MKYFTIKELCYSDTAKKNKINNEPSEVIIEHLTEMVDNLLDPLREAWGSAIKVNSGYRCPSLNTKVGGSKGSSHMHGYAVDLRPSNRRMTEFFEFVKNYLLENNVPFDQLIDERSGGSRWVHIGYKNSKGKQRKEIKLYNNGKYSILKKAEEDNINEN
jgi:hypothetical protein